MTQDNIFITHSDLTANDGIAILCADTTVPENQDATYNLTYEDFSVEEKALYDSFFSMVMSKI